MPKTTITLFQRLAQLRQSIQAIHRELAELAPQVPPVDDGNGFDLGADLRSQLQNAAHSLDEAADMLEPLPEQVQMPVLAQAQVAA